MFERAGQLGLEGIVSKKPDVPYRSGRSEAWLKIKCIQTARFPIVGFIPGAGGISALHLARRKGKQLLYAGKVGTGFNQRTSAEIRRTLEPLTTPQSKLAKPIRAPKTNWVEPKYSAEVEYRDITNEGLLRGSSFKGLVRS